MNNLEESVKKRIRLGHLEMKYISLTEIIWEEEYKDVVCELPKNFIESIKRQGVKIPIGVHIVGDTYHGIYGRKRCLAYQKLNRSDVSAIIYGENLSKAEVSIIRLVENLQRNNPDPIQIGSDCYRYLKDMLGVQDCNGAIEKLFFYGMRDKRCTDKDVEIISTLEKHTKKSYRTLGKLIKLLFLHSKMRCAISEKKIKLCVGYLLAENHDNPRLKDIFGAALHDKYSVTKLKNIINEINGKKMNDSGTIKKCIDTIKRIETIMSEGCLTQEGAKNVLNHLKALCTSIEKCNLSKSSIEQMDSNPVDEFAKGEILMSSDHRGEGDE